ncbi:MAG: histidine phosphatase family protein [Chloroflexota bacterium]
MEQTQLYLIRHGQTDWNKEGRWQGQLNSQLTPLGVEQAKAVANRLEPIPFTALYSSDLDRTMDTAKAIATQTGHEIIPDERLRERAGGVMEGRTSDEAKEAFPEFFTPDVDRWAVDFAYPGGESTVTLLERADKVLTEIAQRHSGERVMIVSHGAFLGTFLRELLEMPITSFRFRMSNCGLSIVSYRKNDSSSSADRSPWMVNTLNETGYLFGIEAAMGEAE